ncbi:MAG: transporter substrate-binding domain-containing protein [Alphaproteobacteria bacterium]|nr:transporter substrate-binding domain-containing protein [Alphaproteobacteria bacterium]
MKVFFILSVVFSVMLPQVAGAQTEQRGIRNGSVQVLPVVAPKEIDEGSALDKDMPEDRNADLISRKFYNPDVIDTYAERQRFYAASYDPKNYVDRIKKRGRVRCGTNTQLKCYAYVAEREWNGIDADFCRAIALAVLGDSNKIDMRHIEDSEISKALQSGKVDVMLSGVPYAAKYDIQSKLIPSGLLYFDPQQLIIADSKGEKAEDFENKKICVAENSDYQRNFEAFNAKFNLQAKYIKFPTMRKAREAFLLKRCELMTAGAAYLNGMKQALTKSYITIIPEHIATTPVYALVHRDHLDFAVAVKWIINALQLAEQYDINAKNVEFFRGHNSTEIRNLMGDNPELWQALHLEPKWLDDAVQIVGHYGQIYERNLGKDSDYKIKRQEGKLLKNGGAVTPDPFM